MHIKPHVRKDRRMHTHELTISKGMYKPQMLQAFVPVNTECRGWRWNRGVRAPRKVDSTLRATRPHNKIIKALTWSEHARQEKLVANKKWDTLHHALNVAYLEDNFCSQRLQLKPAYQSSLLWLVNLCCGALLWLIISVENVHHLDKLAVLDILNLC